jgi:hypothetical protein
MSAIKTIMVAYSYSHREGRARRQAIELAAGDALRWSEFDAQGQYHYHQLFALAPDTPDVRAAVKATKTARVCRRVKPQSKATGT